MLDKLARRLRRMPPSHLTLVAVPGATGAKNLGLSRAEGLRRHLLSRGV